MESFATTKPPDSCQHLVRSRHAALTHGVPDYLLPSGETGSIPKSSFGSVDGSSTFTIVPIQTKTRVAFVFNLEPSDA
jgi:hypothetical protein